MKYNVNIEINASNLDDLKEFTRQLLQFLNGYDNFRVVSADFSNLEKMKAEIVRTAKF